MSVGSTKVAGVAATEVAPRTPAEPVRGMTSPTMTTARDAPIEDCTRRRAFACVVRSVLKILSSAVVGGRTPGNTFVNLSRARVGALPRRSDALSPAGPIVVQRGQRGGAALGPRSAQSSRIGVKLSITTAP